MRPGWAVVKLCLFDSVKTFLFFPNAIVYSSICRCCVNDIDIDVYLWPMLLGASPATATAAAAATGQRIFIRFRARSWTRIWRYAQTINRKLRLQFMTDFGGTFFFTLRVDMFRRKRWTCINQFFLG